MTLVGSAGVGREVASQQIFALTPPGNSKSENSSDLGHFISDPRPLTRTRVVGPATAVPAPTTDALPARGISSRVRASSRAGHRPEWTWKRPCRGCDDAGNTLLSTGMDTSDRLEASVSSGYCQHMAICGTSRGSDDRLCTCVVTPIHPHEPTVRCDV